jgi:mono/diheme cytochrome c family protein
MRILLALVVFGAYGLGTSGCAPAIGPRASTLHETFDAGLVTRGAQLAAIGDCYGCHTARDGAPYAGGLAMRSPFGTIYTSNITPDDDTGIGAWTEEAFRRALREGVRRDGAHLYPAFPYDRFALVTDADAHALYAFLMTRAAVHAEPPPNDLAFPFNMRFGLAAWKALYLRKPSVPIDDPVDDQGWVRKRGAYLVEGLGHCGSCHSPRNAMFAEEYERAYQGGDAEGWHAYAIDRHTKTPVPWDEASLAFYLRNGWHPDHGVARGTMGLVTAELHDATQADVRAMAAYVLTLMGEPATARREAATRLVHAPLAQARDAPGRGRDLYRAACLDCHDGSRALPFGGVPLTLSLGLHGESPRNLINVVLHGLGPGVGETSPIMPGYAGALDEDQVVDLVTWLRANLTDEPPWPDFRNLVRRSETMRRSELQFPPGGAGTDPLMAKAP